MTMARARFDGTRAIGRVIGRWPTGKKLFVLISIALAPLVVIGMLATLESARAVSGANRDRLSFAAEESASVLHREIIADLAELKSAAASLATTPNDQTSCARATAILADQATRGARFAIVDRGDKLLCGERLMSVPNRGGKPGEPAARLDAKGGLLVWTTDVPSRATATVEYPASVLARFTRPTGFSSPFGETLSGDGPALSLAKLPDLGRFNSRVTAAARVGIGDLDLTMEVNTAPLTSPVVVAFVLPLLMWAAAAGIAWFVVDQLLVGPLQRLRASVAGYRPGAVIDPGETNTMPANELRELGDTFRAISRTVAIHEAGLAESLSRQTKLTREVHHRVKNNLQVISSLINIHARGAVSADAREAYGAIQRRVDALAVVHRHHFAEAEATQGLPMRSMLSELAANIRATAGAGDGRKPVAITLDVAPYLLNQDVAVAVAFLVTEVVELAMAIDPAAKVRIGIALEGENRPTLRISSPALVDGSELRRLLDQRYGRVMQGLARQLRAPLQHDGHLGSYEIVIAAVGRD